jgi:GT2 family glycosyltransferase
MSTTDPSTPCVAAILVVHNGEEWLGSALATIAAQRYPALDLVVVDNASRDGGPELLGRHIHADRLITLSRNVGFGRAVAAAMKHPAVEAADYLLLLHDDLVLAPDAIAQLVEAIQADPTLGIVGPKLREWSQEYVLQEVGMTTDRFGRAETQLEPGELDQGQHDHQRDVLYVSTAGMLLRRHVLSMLGGFDARFPAFRDDLDLCWRAWLAGMRVEVVPRAVGYHIAASSRLPRAPLATRSGQARYFAERHTVATLLKNYSTLRLVWVLPIVLLFAVGKIGGFLATRRFADAAAVARAYVWNLRQLPPTLRRRRAVQRRRAISDAELTPLFAPGLPRIRAYAEAVSAWLAGVETRALIDDSGELQHVDERDDTLASKPLLRAFRDHPAACAGAALAICYLIGLIPLLGVGQVVGGEVAPWPSTTRAFLRAYVSSWNGQPLASAGFSSPAQAVLGLLGFLGLGSAWLAQRLLVFGLLPLAWGFALRAGRLITTRKGPRALGATLYALNPVLLGALAQGRYGTLVTAALLPGLVLVTIRAMDLRTAPGSAWRASALLALGLAAVVAFAPVLGLLLGVALLSVMGFVAVRGLHGDARLRTWSRQAALRLAAAGAASVVLNGPWLIDIVRRGGLELRGADPDVLPLWRALTMVPDILDGLRGPIGILAAATSCAVIVAAVGVGLRSRPSPVVGLVTVVAGSGVTAWGASRLGIDHVWVPALLLPGALALAVLGVIATRWLSPSLRAYDFGARQLTTAIAGGIVLIGLVGGVLRLTLGPWGGLSRNPELVPAFVSADIEAVGPYRLLLLADSGGVVRWDVTNATGPSMVDYGTLRSPRLTRFLEAAISRAAGGADPSAGVQFGLANIRYVVLARSSDALTAALARQPALEPLPSSGGRVYRIRTWLPRAVVLPRERGDSLLATGDPGVTALTASPAPSSPPSSLPTASPPAAAPSQGLESARLEARAGLTGYQGRAAGDGGLLVVSEAEDTLWQATVNGKPLERAPLFPVNAFRLPSGQSDVEVHTSGGVGRKIIAFVQLISVLAVISFALRPPGFTRRRVDRSVSPSLPPEFSDPRQTQGVIK